MQSHWSVKFGMALCNYKIKILREDETEPNWLKKVIAVLDYLGVNFFKNLRDF